MEGFTTINFLKDTLFNIPQMFYIFLDFLMDLELFSLWGTSWRFWTLLKWREGCQYWNGEGIGRGCQNLITMSDCWDYNDYIVGLLSPLSFHCVPWPLCCREIGAHHMQAESATILICIGLTITCQRRAQLSYFVNMETTIFVAVCVFAEVSFHFADITNIFYSSKYNSEELDSHDRKIGSILSSLHL